MEQKIFKLIESVKISRFINYQAMRDPSLARSHEYGEIAYYKKKVSDLMQEVENKSIIGQLWLEWDCKHNLDNPAWLQRYYEAAIERIPENDVIEDIKWFVNQFLTIKEYEEIVNKSDKWKLLHEGLIDLGLIQNNDNDNFSAIMEGNYVPDRNDRIMWIGTKVDGWRFCDHFKFKVAYFKKRFQHIDGKDFHNHDRSGTDPSNELKDLFKKYQ